jgi:predicted  nucleic acid-binding Zn-ribbon protein
MSQNYLQKLAEVEKLIVKMDLPMYRKTVKHNDDLRWLKNNLSVRNDKHKNYEKAMELLNSLV